MAIREALQSAALRLIGRRPGTFFGASQGFEAEICDLANEVARDVAKYRDWQALTKLAIVTGDGTTTEFSFPADYDRQLQNAELQQTSGGFWGYRSFGDINGFVAAEARDFDSLPGGWIIYGNKLRFAPAPPTSPSVTYPYISTMYAVGSDTVAKAEFTADTDSFLLPERLLTLGLVWRWRENKKLDYSGDMEAFTKALDEYAAKDRGARVIRRNSRRTFPGTYDAWPWELG